ncbi:MAG: bifunctional nicotinamidase/pyrazinamidase [Rhodothermales bacterium]
MHALLVVDIQNDFCPGGRLPVPGGDEIIPAINKLATTFDHVLLTQDWHPEGHRSFASSHSGKRPFDTIEVPYGEQILWPDHCIQGSRGAQFHRDLDVNKAELIIRKGFRKEIDSYSAFFENDHETPTGLTGYLRERGIDTLFIAGLATDFCVHWSAVDGRKHGFEVYVIEDASRGIDTMGSMNYALLRIKESGAELITAEHASRVATRMGTAPSRTTGRE